MLPELEAFDSTECATAPRRSGYPLQHNRHRDIANLERLAAELFATRAAFEKERRAYVQLQQAHEQLAKDMAACRGADAPLSAVPHGGAAALGGGS